MKRIRFIITVFGCLLVLSACSSGATVKSAEPTPAEATEEAEATEAVSESPSMSEVSEVELTLQFSFGERTGVYSGEMADGLPHGQGTFSTQNEEGTAWVYEGGWREGHLYGEGTTTFETGYMEVGWYEDDNLNGQGSLYQDGRLTYEGEFSGNIPDGQGTLYSYCGEVIFSGSFSEGYIDETEEARGARLADFKQTCEARDYEALVESAAEGDALRAKLSGTVYYVFEPDESGYDSSFFMDEPEGNLVCVSYRLRVGENAVAPGKKVIVWGIADYLYTYETETGSQASLPMIEAWDVMDVSGTAM